ncbi:hypothetical protein AVEN_42070-1 [Araneus ventricosus]|uniref:Uncharacterized protein n=1 Tax=Araneus ventricosus TaxID=182803 RepID=A0A4Y2W6K4_ARAVE|nr:hypothetical protein AVEN_42070-1 [Araneus ventricosus]
MPDLPPPEWGYSGVPKPCSITSHARDSSQNGDIAESQSLQHHPKQIPVTQNVDNRKGVPGPAASPHARDLPGPQNGDKKESQSSHTLKQDSWPQNGDAIAGVPVSALPHARDLLARMGQQRSPSLRSITSQSRISCHRNGDKGVLPPAAPLLGA